MLPISGAMVKRSIDAFETSVAAATTIAARMPMLTLAGLGGGLSARNVVEAQRMVTEKAEAAFAGAVAAGTAWATMWVRMGFGMIQPHEVVEEAAKVVDAACAPAMATCRKNAKRLAPKRGGSSMKRRRK